MAGSQPVTPQIPLVDLKAQYAGIRAEIDGAIRRVVKGGDFVLGAEVADFEQDFAAYVGSRSAVGVASGTAALRLALEVCGVGPGDEVITTAHTFMATAEAVSRTGARPVFVDIDPVTFTIDPSLVEAAITPRTRAIIAVHLYGHPADVDALAAVARAHGLRLIEDAAQAHGAEYRGRRCGSLGDLACFSFYPGKNLGAYGDAGAVTGDDEELLARVRKLRDHGRLSKYEHDEIGFGERMDALQAAILGVKLAHLDRWTEARRANAARYGTLLGGCGLALPYESHLVRHAYHLYVIRTEGRDRLLAHLKARGVGAGVHYPLPLHRQPAYLRLGYGSVSLPATEAAASEVLSLPVCPEVGGERISYIAAAVREVCA